MKGRTPQECKSGSKTFRVTTKCMETKEKNEYFVSKHSFSYGAVDEIRTRDIHLGKVALYH